MQAARDRPWDSAPVSAISTERGANVQLTHIDERRTTVEVIFDQLVVNRDDIF
jgi:hypothetical protein